MFFQGTISTVFEKFTKHLIEFVTFENIFGGETILDKFFGKLFGYGERLKQVQKNIKDLSDRIGELAKAKELAEKYGMEDKVQKEIDALTKERDKLKEVEQELKRLVSQQQKAGKGIENIEDMNEALNKYGDSVNAATKEAEKFAVHIGGQELGLHDPKAGFVAFRG